MGNVSIVSENYYKYDNSDYAQSLRKIYGEDGYNKYFAKMNSVIADAKSREIINPIAISKRKYIKRKEEEYALANERYNKALAALNNASDSNYQNAKYNFQNANFDRELAFSLMKDAKTCGLSMLS